MHQEDFVISQSCSSDRYGNYRPKAACAHRESALCADEFACGVCPVATFCVHHTAAALFKSQSVRHPGHLVV